MDVRLRRHEPDRAAVRARAREERVDRRRLRVPVRVHVLPGAARPARGVDHDDDDARVSRSAAAARPRRARVPLPPRSALPRRCSCSRPRRCSSCSPSRCSACSCAAASGAHDAAVTADTLQVFAIGLVPFSVYLYTLRGVLRAAGHAHAVLDQRDRERAQHRARGRAVPVARRAGPRPRVERRVHRRRGRLALVVARPARSRTRSTARSSCRPARRRSATAALAIVAVVARGRDRPRDREPRARRHRGRGPSRASLRTSSSCSRCARPSSERSSACCGAAADPPPTCNHGPCRTDRTQADRTTGPEEDPCPFAS